MFTSAPKLKLKVPDDSWLCLRFPDCINLPIMHHREAVGICWILANDRKEQIQNGEKVWNKSIIRNSCACTGPSRNFATILWNTPWSNKVSNHLSMKLIVELRPKTCKASVKSTFVREGRKDTKWQPKYTKIHTVRTETVSSWQHSLLCRSREVVYLSLF